jgi:hypothetical protein
MKHRLVSLGTSVQIIITNSKSLFISKKGHTILRINFLLIIAKNHTALLSMLNHFPARVMINTPDTINKNEMISACVGLKGRNS